VAAVQAASAEPTVVPQPAWLPVPHEPVAEAEPPASSLQPVPGGVAGHGSPAAAMAATPSFDQLLAPSAVQSEPEPAIDEVPAAEGLLPWDAITAGDDARDQDEEHDAAETPTPQRHSGRKEAKRSRREAATSEPVVDSEDHDDLVDDDDDEDEGHDHKYTWLHYLILVAVAFVFGLILWKVGLADSGAEVPTGSTGESSLVEYSGIPTSAESL
jgi:hypothetical protein